MLERALLILIFAAPVVLVAAPAVGQSARTSVPAPARQPSAAIELESLLATFASMEGLAARFREEKHLALLREPLVSRGSLYFSRPDRIVRYVEHPIRSVLLLHGSELAMGTAQGRRRLDLNSHPLIGALVDSFRQLLNGNLDGLRAHYQIDLERAGGEDWRIHLVPLHSPLRDHIAEIRFSGRGSVPTRFRVVEVSGDETVTHLYEVESNRRFEEHEIAELFRLPAP